MTIGTIIVLVIFALVWLWIVYEMYMAPEVDNNADWSTMDLDSDFEAELLVYDQMLSSVSKKTVCIGCLKEDDELWKKYYDKDDDDDFNEIIFDADF